MNKNKGQRSVVLVALFALITLLILYSSNSVNDVFPYSPLRGHFHRTPNLRKWAIADSYVPVLGNKGEVSILAEHRLVHHGNCCGAM
ncbi:alpha-N-acetylgalactosaminide alpha-2,6-sialyltransferase 6 isoform X2 [Notamacropus eugenii]|uniref:alpha-N-acetylgalactosaminide alpha-2,6-sialyltransferase 6 isoform X2 n=1 Tax=Notamacropus eugenii TaxID=9315 RepID=UPI003B67D541